MGGAKLSLPRLRIIKGSDNSQVPIIHATPAWTLKSYHMRKKESPIHSKHLEEYENKSSHYHNLCEKGKKKIVAENEKERLVKQ